MNLKTNRQPHREDDLLSKKQLRIGLENIEKEMHRWIFFSSFLLEGI